MPETTGLAIFCDDIRHELGGKVSYMGIYGEDLIIPSPKPVLLPKLSIAAHIRIPAEISNPHLRVVVLKETGAKSEELMTMEGDIESVPNESAEPGAFLQANVHLNAVPFQIADDCILKVRAYINDVECKLGTLPVRFVTPTTE